MRVWNEIKEELDALDHLQNDIDTDIAEVKMKLATLHERRTSLFNKRRDLQVEALKSEGRPVFPTKTLDGMQSNRSNYLRLLAEKTK